MSAVIGSAANPLTQMATIGRDVPSMIKSKAESPFLVSKDLEGPPPPGSKIEPRLSAVEIPEASRKFWSASLLASLAFHGAVAGALLTNWSFLKSEEAPPPAAMVVELAVMPASPPVTPTEIPPGPEQVEAAPKPKPLDAMKFDPLPTVDAALKPQFTLPIKEETRPVETPAEAKETRETTAPQAVHAPVEDKNAAPVEGSNSAPPSNAEQAWIGRILAKLERNKRYPSAAMMAGQQDTVFVRMVIDRKGRLMDASLKKSHGIMLLDTETLSLARRSSPYPAPPEDSVKNDKAILVVPVDFYVTKR